MSQTAGVLVCLPAALHYIKIVFYDTALLNANKVQRRVLRLLADLIRPNQNSWSIIVIIGAMRYRPFVVIARTSAVDSSWIRGTQ